MNKIVIGDSLYTFTDPDILDNPQKYISNAMLADSLEIDTLDFRVLSYAIGKRKLLTSLLEWYTTVNGEGYVVDAGDLRKLPFGTPVYLYKDNALRGRFFFKQATRVGLLSYDVKCISAIGLLDGITHLGGIYNGETVGEVVADILQDVEYTIADDVASVTCYGWLPIASCRDNLAQVLFSCGASVLKDRDGKLNIRFNGVGNPIVVPINNTYMGGTVSIPQKATKIILIEHGYAANDDTVESVLFDNTEDAAAINSTLYFEAPYHSLRAEGLTVHSSGANWAIVSGQGVLYGKECSHSQREIVENINNDSEPNEVNIKEATLISALNSANTMDRIISYYADADIIQSGIVDDIGYKPGDYIQFTSPFGEETTGFIQTMNETVSGIDKSDTTIVTNWNPSNFGNNYKNYALLTGFGTFEIPEGVTRMRIHLIGGGQGGYSGGNGQDSQDESKLLGGEGGIAGDGGHSGYVLIRDIELDGSISSIDYECGTGGDGGSQISGGSQVAPKAGTLGTATTITIGEEEYTSDSGAIPAHGVTNTFTGDLFAVSGEDGQPGGNGSDRANPRTSITYNANTYYSGSFGKDYEYSVNRDDFSAGGGCGGGPSISANGGNGRDANRRAHKVNNGSYPYGYWYVMEGGAGGTGADGPDAEEQTAYGCGGNGGHGGGGGGAGGPGNWEAYDGAPSYGFRYWGYRGIGGKGGNGSKGGDGCVLIYY